MVFYNRGLHWKNLYRSDKEFYDLAYMRTAEVYQDYDDPEDAPAALECYFGSRGASITLDIVDGEAESLFAWGYCTLLALALHETTGAPLVLFTKKYIPEENIWTGHAVVQLDENTYVDITGRITAEEINSKYRMNVTPHVVTRDEFCEIVASDEHVENPMTFVDELEQKVTYRFASYIAKNYM